MMCVEASWPQVKTHKNKLVALVAGADRHICVMLSFACAYAMGCFEENR